MDQIPNNKVIALLERFFPIKKTILYQHTNDQDTTRLCLPNLIRPTNQKLIRIRLITEDKSFGQFCNFNYETASSIASKKCINRKAIFTLQLLVNI